MDKRLIWMSDRRLHTIKNWGNLRLVQWFSKWGPRPPGSPGAECRGSASIQSNIGGPCTFKQKIDKNNYLNIDKNRFINSNRFKLYFFIRTKLKANERKKRDKYMYRLYVRYIMSVVLKVGSASPRGSASRVSGVRDHLVEYRGSLYFKRKKNENNRTLFGDIGYGPIVELA